jgi:hypothetical protein
VTVSPSGRSAAMMAGPSGTPTALPDALPALFSGVRIAVISNRPQPPLRLSRRVYSTLGCALWRGARALARFHRRRPPAPPDSDYPLGL